jgi:transposase
MRKIRELLRLKFEAGLSDRRIARSLQLARSTVSEYLRRFAESELGWPPPEISDTELEQRLFPPAPLVAPAQRSVPDWSWVHQELRRPGVTLFLLWHEYKAGSAVGYQYSWFCDQYRAWRGRVDRVMRQSHRAGEKLFVDYAGQTLEIVDPTTGEIRAAQIFVAVLGASSYTFAEATWSQSLPDWLGSHGRAFAFFGGVPELVVPDNLKSGVTKAHRYEPDLNPSYRDLAEHYGVVVIPARVRKPRDKAKVESGVLLVERWILAALRHRTFFSLAEANQAIRQLLDRLNTRPFKKLPGCRRDLFEAIDRPVLGALPATPYVFAEWKRVRVHIDYHVELDGHYYSVPHTLVKQELEVRFTAHTVECFHRGQRVASHPRSSLKGRHTTLAEHMPKGHREYAEWSPERFLRWAQSFGAATRSVIQQVLQQRQHPQQGYRSCLGILRLGKEFGAERLEAACARALLLGTCRYQSLQSILRQGLDQQHLPQQQELALEIDHANIRGADYYH